MPRARGRAADQEEASVFAKRDSLHVLTALSLLQELAELQSRVGGDVGRLVRPHQRRLVVHAFEETIVLAPLAQHP